MNVWPGIITLVKSKSAITDLIGTNPTRLYPSVLPQGLSTFPAISYRTVTIVSNPNFDGASQLDHAMVDFHIFADTKSEVEELADTLRDELEDEEGIFSGLTIKNVRYVDSGQDDWLDDIEKHSKQIEFNYSHTR